GDRPDAGKLGIVLRLTRADGAENHELVFRANSNVERRVVAGPARVHGPHEPQLWRPAADSDVEVTDALVERRQDTDAGGERRVDIALGVERDLIDPLRAAAAAKTLRAR